MFPYSEGDAEIVATLYNIHRDQKKRSKPYTRADFLPGLAIDDDEDPGESLFNRLRPLAEK